MTSNNAIALLVLALVGSVATAQADAAKQESRLITGVRQLTYEGRRAGEGYYDRTGTKMVFQSEREPGNPFYQIYLMDLELGDVERISPGKGKTTCAWVHPDGNRVMFSSTHADPESVAKQKEELAFRASGKQRRYAWDYDEAFDVFAYDRKKKTYANLSRVRGYDAEGCYSPDGKLIVFSSNRHAYTEPISERDREIFAKDKAYMLDLYIMRSDGTDVRRLTTARGYDGGPFFSADGSKICWRRFSPNGAQAEVYTMNVDGTGKKKLTSLSAMSWAPFFHPSGEYLIFTTNRHGFANFELYLVDADGAREPVRVTYTDGFDGLPTFTPDGKTLAWTSNRTPNKQSQIFTGKWNHAAARELLRKSGAGPINHTPSAKGVPGGGPTAPEIRVSDLGTHVGYLASEKCAGRMTGTAGERLATAYAAQRFGQIGLRPGGNGGTFFQEFQFSAGGGHGQPKISGTGRNVVAVLPASSDEAKKRPALVIGAHIDHLGTTGGAYSRAANEEKKKLHLGADDNASGVSALLEVAEYLADLKKRGKLNLARNVVFACWSGEELGLFGSKHFVKQLAREDDTDIRNAVAAYLNMDMIGRFRKQLIVSGVGSSSIWPREIERRNIPVGLPLSLVQDCYLSTDTTSFYLKGVPILNLFTGAHSDYHSPADTPDKLDYEGMRRIARFMALLARSVATNPKAPDYILTERTQKPTRPTASRPYLGSIPDYAKAPIPGLRLSGVAKNGPSWNAGVRGGDIIVQLGDLVVKDIYGYTEAIDKLEIGKATKIVVVRKGQRLTFTVVPGSRE